MQTWIECVPNFSEGRDPQRLAEIAKAIRSVPGVRLLHIDAGIDANRSVFTFFASAESIGEAAFRGVKRSLELIDMRQHHGVHPRIGAADVVPFVPWQNSSMEQCRILARQLSERLAQECNLPCYLYAEAAVRPQCRDLAQLRRGQYEQFAIKIQQPEWQPDFGPAVMPPKSGVSAIGARPVLVAFNITLASNEVEIAQRIARTIRTSGYQGRAGLFHDLKAIGWSMPQYGRAQVSMNILNPQVSPIHQVFAEVERQAKQLGTTVTGSQLVGMIPRQYLLAGFRSLPEAVEALRLDDLAPFSLDQRVIELALT